MQGVIEVERDVADLDDLLHQSHDSQRPMQTVRSLYANFYAIANPRRKGRRPGFTGLAEARRACAGNVVATIAGVVRADMKKPAGPKSCGLLKRLVPRGRLELPLLSKTDFESAASTDSATGAQWRRSIGTHPAPVNRRRHRAPRQWCHACSGPDEVAVFIAALRLDCACHRERRVGWGGLGSVVEREGVCSESCAG